MALNKNRAGKLLALVAVSAIAIKYRGAPDINFQAVALSLGVFGLIVVIGFGRSAGFALYTPTKTGRTEQFC